MRVLLNVEENFDESFCNKESAQLLWSIFVEAARNNIDSDTLSGLIGTSDICCAVLQVYNENKAALRDTMGTIGWEYPKVVGIDWSILSVVESNSNMEIEEPLAEITLKTLGTGDPSPQLDTFKFLCNKNHLQEFHWKVKEVNNILQSFAHKSG
ncbi:putative COMM domain-containing protein 3-like [Ditylenchus destructor]|uniref:COMM domain-containing protein 3-like n=1 Tax=Ditylenchus destructor TaxID=166010 RepID=A0AAD4N1Z7_9BILA|nr:putative COMM domain-containing protein 3-like [Ditylenchus destructor]